MVLSNLGLDEHEKRLQIKTVLRFAVFLFAVLHSRIGRVLFGLKNQFDLSSTPPSTSLNQFYLPSTKILLLEGVDIDNIDHTTSKFFTALDDISLS